MAVPISLNGRDTETHVGLVAAAVLHLLQYNDNYTSHGRNEHLHHCTNWSTHLSRRRREEGMEGVRMEGEWEENGRRMGGGWEEDGREGGREWVMILSEGEEDAREEDYEL